MGPRLSLDWGMTRFFLAPLAIFFLVLATPVRAEDITLEDFAWLAGQWIEARDDGTTIEINWAPPIGPMMIGTWQLLEGDSLLAYENLRIIETATGFEYRREQYVRSNNFAVPTTTRIGLVTVEANKAVFEGPLTGETDEVVFTIEITEDGELYGWAVFLESPEQKVIVSYRAAHAGK